MPDFLDTLVKDAKATVASGYYSVSERKTTFHHASLKRAIDQCRKMPIIAEVKAASPSAGAIRDNLDARTLAMAIASGGAVGISVLTEPRHFQGVLDNLGQVKGAVNTPVLMKDFIVSLQQLEAASKLGADAVLLVKGVFDRGYCEESLENMISEAHSRQLEVLLETHTRKEFRNAVETEADLVGINNRDLTTLNVDLKVTKDIMSQCSTNDKTVVSESGIQSLEDLRYLRECGAKAFLIGSAVMRSGDVEAKVKEFVGA